MANRAKPDPSTPFATDMGLHCSFRQACLSFLHMVCLNGEYIQLISNYLAYFKCKMDKSTFILPLKGIDTSGTYFTISTKEDNFCDLFAFSAHKSPSEKGSIL